MKTVNRTKIYKRLMEPEVDADYKNLLLKLIDPKESHLIRLPQVQ